MAAGKGDDWKNLKKIPGINELRVRDHMFGGGVIADGKEAMLFLGEDKPSLVIWSNHVGLVGVCEGIFPVSMGFFSHRLNLITSGSLPAWHFVIARLVGFSTQTWLAFVVGSNSVRKCKRPDSRVPYHVVRGLIYRGRLIEDLKLRSIGHDAPGVTTVTWA